MGEEERHWKREEHILPYLPSGKWSLFWWRVGKVAKWIGEKTGFKNKTLWDVLQLGLLPAVITFATFLYNNNQSKLQIDLERQKYQQTALDNYITEMTNIIIDRDLVDAGFKPINESGSPIETSNEVNQYQKEKQKKYLANIAKAKTLTKLLLPNLKKSRQNTLLYFLRTQELCCEESKTPDLKSISILEGIRLQGADLKAAELDEFNLKNAILSKAKLNNAQLSMANLQGANLNDAEMQDATLTLADLTNAQLYKTNLEQSTLRGAILKESKLIRANLNQADLSKAPIDDEKFKKLTQQKNNLNNLTEDEDGKSVRTDLSNAILLEASLQETNLEGAILTKSRLDRANLSHANLKGAILTEAKFDGTNLSHANLEGATEDVKIDNAKLCHTKMQDSTIQNRDCWWAKVFW